LTHDIASDIWHDIDLTCGHFFKYKKLKKNGVSNYVLMLITHT